MAGTTLEGGPFVDLAGNPLANGQLVFQLSQDGNYSESRGQVSGDIKVTITLDDNGNVASGQSVIPTDALAPTGITYTVWAYNENGQLAWGPNYGITVPSSPNPYNVNNFVPNLVLAPLPSLGGLTLQTNGVDNQSQEVLDLIAGSGVSLTAGSDGDVTISATGGGGAGLPWLNIVSYGAVGDANLVTDAVCMSGSNIISSASANFSLADVGKQFSLTTVAYNTSHQITGTITGYTNSTTITVSTNALTNASGCRLTYGTDNTTAIQAAINAAEALIKGGNGSSNTNNTAADIPPILFPSPTTGIGYIISAALEITTQGICFTSGAAGGLEASQIILNAPAACINYSAPSGTYHSYSQAGVCLEGNYVANYGIKLNTIEECEFFSFRCNNCLVAAVSIVSGGLTRWCDFRGEGSVTTFLLDNTNSNEFYGLNIFGFETSPTPVTFSAFQLVGTGVQNIVIGGFFEGFNNIVYADNSAGTMNYDFSMRDAKLNCSLTDGLFLNVNSQNTGNLLLLNALFDGLHFNYTSSPYLLDVLLNANLAGSTQVNIAFKHNFIIEAPSISIFNTDDSRTRIAFADNFNVGTT
jgi:hypothetical protein